VTALRTGATASRVLGQIRHDPRTIGLLLVVPCVLLGLMAWVFLDTPIFDQVGAPILGLFPFVVMFIVTSVVMLRERQGGTLERLMTTPIGRADLLLGYASAFGALAVVQAVVATGFSVWIAGLDVAGDVWVLVVVAVAVAVLGVTLGLLGSAFASTELQAVQLMPAFVLPQLFLCGLFVPRDQLPTGLEQLSAILPLSYAVDAMRTVTVEPGAPASVWGDLTVLLAFIVGAIVLASLTLRRRTP
jgi:ABC-2 type transport system permease protein